MMQSDWLNPATLQWCQSLLDSYYHWIKQELIPRHGTILQQAERLFCSKFVVASHDSEVDPVLNYGNQTALNLWELPWQQFTQTPSRLTAEPINREARAKMLMQVQTQGFVTDYSGIRITSTGKRFIAEQITIWNILNSRGVNIGQGATFSTWKYLSDR